MPELPEVETVRRILSNQLIGLVIEDIDVYYEKMIHEDLDLFKSKLIGQKIQKIDRIGKYLIFILDHDALIIHLRMEGKFYINKKEPKSKHEHVIFHLSNDIELRYHDTRKFGTMHLRSLKDYLNTYPLSTCGMEPFTIDKDWFYEKINKKNVAIKSILLDQRIISGLGNIYVDETLFDAKIHPERKGLTIKKNESDQLIDSAIKVLNEAVNLGGSTIRSYTASLGVTGFFQLKLMVHTKVNQPCQICGTTIKKIRVGGRGTYVCETCQK